MTHDNIRAALAEPSPDKCPCCGSAASFHKMPNEESHPNAGAEFIMCDNGRCMLATALVFPLMGDVKALLLERWNRRALPSPKADALAGLVGWAQMILAQPDMPADLRSRFSNNHRLTTAVIALAADGDRL